MAREHSGKVWIALRREDCNGMPHRPERDSGDPQLEPDAEGAATVPLTIATARGAPQQDGLGKGPMQWDLEALDRGAGHETSAPPPKEKNERQKLDAAKAIEMPKTI